MIIGVDFDGTVVKHAFPAIGEELPHAIETLKLLQDHGHYLMLWTMRSGETLVEAVKFLEDRGINLWGVNENTTQYKWSQSKKQYAHLYIDDAAIGCPLLYPEGERPEVDWMSVRALLKHQGVLPMAVG
jgi:hydroxymethylpyrimidine pyrophosphatase-like HAD family hydrolase